MAITVEMRTQVSQLYVALFGRAPDAEGLGFWVQMLDNGSSLVDVANTMYATSPARDYYPLFLTNQEIIASFYLNVLGRTADADGLAFWTAKLNAAGATPGSVIAEMINVVANYAGTDPAGLESQALFNNKVEVAQYYGENGGTIAGATAILAGVTSDDATVEAAKDAIDDGTTVVGATYAMTTSIDNLVADSGNNTINATLKYDEDDTNPDTGTYNAGDIVDGGAGQDTLDLTVVENDDNSPSWPDSGTNTMVQLKSVEVVNIRDLDGDNLINGTLWEGVERLEVATVGSNSWVGVTQLQNNMVLAIDGTTGSDDSNYNFIFAAGALGGDADLSLELDSVGSDDNNNYVWISLGDGDVAKSLAIEVTGDNNVELDLNDDNNGSADELETLTLTGAGTLTLSINSEEFDSLVTFDASANTGGVTVDLSDANATITTIMGSAGDDDITVNGTDADATIELGAGDDVLRAGAGDLDDATTIDGGDGEDMIAATTIALANADAFENFEVLDVAGLAASSAFDLDFVSASQFTKLAITGSLSSDVVVSNLAVGTSLEVTGDANWGDLRINFKNATGTADTFDVNFNVDNNNNNNIDTLRLDGIEVVNLNSTGGDDNAYSTINNLRSSTITTLNITGDTDVNLYGFTNVTSAGLNSLTTIDAHTFTGDLDLWMSDLVAQQTATVKANVSYTIKTGTGDDLVDLVSSDSAANKNTTANVDVSAGGDDTIDVANLVGDADVISVATGTTGSMAVLTGMDDGDEIQFAGAVTATVGAEYDIGTAATLAAALDGAAAATGDIAWFVVSGNTYIIVDADASGTYNAADNVVKLVGEYDLEGYDVTGSLLTFG